MVAQGGYWKRINLENINVADDGKEKYFSVNTQHSVRSLCNEKMETLSAPCGNKPKGVDFTAIHSLNIARPLCEGHFLPIWFQNDFVSCLLSASARFLIARPSATLFSEVIRDNGDA
jgi:hypothetical protein